MSHQLSGHAEFSCAICDAPIRFDPEDSTTFTSKTPHDKFFGMQLTTFRVSHIDANERHVNTVIIDHQGIFRGFKDAFSEPVEEHLGGHSFRLVGSDSKSLQSHPYFDLLLVLDIRNRWIMELLNGSSVRIQELAMLIEERIIETKRVYEKLPDQLSVVIADRDVKIWLKESKAICVILKTPAAFSAFGAMASRYVTFLHDPSSRTKRLLKLVLRVLAIAPKTNPENLLRLLTDDLLVVRHEFPFTTRVSSIIERVAKRYPLAADILPPLLKGYSSTVDLLEQGHLENLTAVYDIIDFVNRRGLLG